MRNIISFSKNDDTVDMMIKSPFVVMKHTLPVATLSVVLLIALFGDNPELALTPPSDPALLAFTTHLLGDLSIGFGAYKSLCEAYETTNRIRKDTITGQNSDVFVNKSNEPVAKRPSRKKTVSPKNDLTPKA